MIPIVLTSLLAAEPATIDVILRAQERRVIARRIVQVDYVSTEKDSEGRILRKDTGRFVQSGEKLGLIAKVIESTNDAEPKHVVKCFGCAKDRTMFVYDPDANSTAGLAASFVKREFFDINAFGVSSVPFALREDVNPRNYLYDAEEFEPPLIAKGEGGHTISTARLRGTTGVLRLRYDRGLRVVGIDFTRDDTLKMKSTVENEYAPDSGDADFPRRTAIVRTINGKTTSQTIEIERQSIGKLIDADFFRPETVRLVEGDIYPVVNEKKHISAQYNIDSKMQKLPPKNYVMPDSARKKLFVGSRPSTEPPVIVRSDETNWRTILIGSVGLVFVALGVAAIVAWKRKR
jgi:hypothetical protein